MTFTVQWKWWSGDYSGHMRERFSRYIGLRPWEQRRGLWISEGPHSLSHRRFFFLYFQLKSSILRVVSACPRGPKAVLFCLAKYLLEALRLLMHYNLKVSMIFIVCLQFPLKVRISIGRLKLLSVILRYIGRKSIVFGVCIIVWSILAWDFLILIKIWNSQK